MELVRNLLLAGHLLGLALLIGTFFVQMRAKWGFRFDLLLIGASVQLLTGVGLYGVVMATGTPNHVKLGIKTLIAVVIFIAALVGFLKQRKLRQQKAAVSTGAAGSGAGGSGAGGAGLGGSDADAQGTGLRGVAGIASAVDERSLMPFFHTAGGLAVVNLLIAVLWR